MSQLDLAPTDDAVEDYYDQLDAYERVGAQHEGAVRTAFRDLLDHGGSQMGWELVPEWSPRDRRIRIDGALLDEYRLTHGFWEAKDSDDDLEGIPKRAHDYRLAHKSALEWLTSRYRIKTYGRYDITHDPNDPDDKWHIVDLIKRVTRVSVETVEIVEDLPELELPSE